MSAEQLLLVGYWVLGAFTVGLLWVARIFDKAHERMYVAMLEARRDRDEFRQNMWDTLRVDVTKPPHPEKQGDSQQ